MSPEDRVIQVWRMTGLLKFKAVLSNQVIFLPLSHSFLLFENMTYGLDEETETEEILRLRRLVVGHIR
ncbi:hypothetical protein HDU93_004220, partial [Gonapodya sp. JEL0774]